MKIGFLFNASENDGGVFQYTCSLFDALLKVKNHKVFIFTPFPNKLKRIGTRDNLNFIKILDIGLNNNKTKGTFGIQKFVLKYFSVAYKFLYKYDPLHFIEIINKRQNVNLVEIIDRQKLDLMIFPSPTNVALHIKVPFIFSVHDLQHRINPQFPEVSSNGIWESREHSYRLLCKKAKIILVDSAIGKEDVVNCYDVNPKKIEILGYLSPSYLKINISFDEAKKHNSELGMFGKYIYYPAKFWPHKNHINLLKALKIVNKNKKDKLSLVLTGANIAENSTYGAVMSFALKNDLRKYIKYLGIVNNITQSSLYKCAEALVMPTFFGPTNIPVLEAWKMKTPVIYSDIRGCREQLGNAGLLINPNDPSDIADKINKIVHNQSLRKELIKKGNKRLNLWTDKEFKNKVIKIIDDFARI